jgi:hypothetical protein
MNGGMTRLKRKLNKTDPKAMGATVVEGGVEVGIK